MLQRVNGEKAQANHHYSAEENYSQNQLGEKHYLQVNTNSGNKKEQEKENISNEYNRQSHKNNHTQMKKCPLQAQEKKEIECIYRKDTTTPYEVTASKQKWEKKKKKNKRSEEKQQQQQPAVQAQVQAQQQSNSLQLDRATNVQKKSLPQPQKTLGSTNLTATDTGNTLTWAVTVERNWHEYERERVKEQQSKSSNYANDDENSDNDDDCFLVFDVDGDNIDNNNNNNISSTVGNYDNDNDNDAECLAIFETRRQESALERKMIRQNSDQSINGNENNNNGDVGWIEEIQTQKQQEKDSHKQTPSPSFRIDRDATKIKPDTAVITTNAVQTLASTSVIHSTLQQNDNSSTTTLVNDTHNNTYAKATYESKDNNHQDPENIDNIAKKKPGEDGLSPKHGTCTTNLDSVVKVALTAQNNSDMSESNDDDDDASLEEFIQKRKELENKKRMQQNKVNALKDLHNTVSTHKVSHNTVSHNTVSHNTVSHNTVSQRILVSFALISTDQVFTDSGRLHFNTLVSTFTKQISIRLDLLQMRQGLGPVQNAVAFHRELATKLTILKWINSRLGTPHNP